MKKKLSSLLVFALVLTMLAPAFAFAATPADVKGTAYASAVTELAALGVLGGYPDGTFKPDNSITRAEFAKVVAYAAGFASAAEYLGGQNTNFKDVKSDHWASGYIAVASNKGYLKGYPDGNFKPNNKVTYAEAVTVLLRVLGYNDNLTGTWPSDYIIQANTLGLISSNIAAEFKANDAAKRGSVAVLANNTLSKSLVTYDKDTDRFNASATTLFAVAFTNASWTQNVVVAAPKLTSEGNLELVGQAALATDNLEIVGGEDLSFHLGHVVDVLVVNGKAKVLKHDASTKKVSGVLDEAVSVTNATYTANGTPDFSLKGETSDRAIAQGAIFYYNGVKVAAAQVTASVGANVELFLDANNNVRFAIIKSYDAALKGVLAVKTTEKTSVRDARLYYTNDVTYVSVTDSAAITRNGASAKLSDIKANDVLYVGLNTDSKAVVIDAYSKVVNGKIDVIRTSGATTTVTVAGTAYTSNVAEDANGDPLLVGSEYTFYLGDGDVVFSAVPKVAAVTANPVYVVVSEPKVIVETVNGASVTKEVYLVTARDLTSKEEVKYFTKDRTINLATGNIVTITLKDGKIDSTGAVTGLLTDDTFTVVNADNKIVELGGNNYQVTDTTVIVSTDNASEGKIASYDNLKAANNTSVQYVTSGFTVKYVFIGVNTGATSGATAKTGVFVEKYSIVNANNDVEYHVVLNVNGASVDLMTDAATVTGDVYLSKGNLVNVTDASTNGKYDTAQLATKFTQMLNANATNKTFEAVTTFDSNATTGTKYFLASDVVVYVVTKNSTGVQSIAVGDAADVLGLNDSDAAVDYSLVADGTVTLGGYTKVTSVVVVKTVQ